MLLYGPDIRGMPVYDEKTGPGETVYADRIWDSGERLYLYVKGYAMNFEIVKEKLGPGGTGNA